REAPIHAVSPRLTDPSSLLSFPGCPIGRRRTSLYLDTGAPSGRNRIRRKFRASLGLWRESEAFLRRQQRRSLKTQQRAFTSRPHRPFGAGEETNEPVTA